MLPGQFARVMVVGGVRLEVVALSKSIPGESTTTKLFVSRTDFTNCMLVEFVGGVVACTELLHVAIACSPAELATYTNGPEGSWVTSLFTPPKGTVCADRNGESTYTFTLLATT